MGPKCPNGPSNLVGQSDGRDVMVAPLYQLMDPAYRLTFAS